MLDREPDPSELAARLADLCARHRTAGPEMIAEVEDLGRTIAAAKAEIAALRVDDVTTSQIPSAADELDAVVAHTATATETILEACEALDRTATAMDGPQADALQAATVRIYEACSFQDITGQRITKVVSTLKAIDAKVAQIVSTFGGNPHVADAPVPERAPLSAEAGLLNGPQLPKAAMDQDEIDRMLADF